MKRETLGEGDSTGHLEILTDPYVCVVEMGKWNIAEGCRKYEGVAWGKGGSSCFGALVEEVRKKCKESSGKGILIIESRGGQPRVQNFSSKNVESRNF